MDVTCPTCGEPYDTYHMKFDEIYETALPQNIQNDLHEKGTPLYPWVKVELEKLGWRFSSGATSVLSFVRCPCCPKDAETDKDKALKMKVLSDLLGDDEDGLASMIEDME